ncbi:MAG: hypothetical protein RIQ41_393 [Candidatus Parcubacteria bacterium]|jgi:DNA-binding response OmpR family regulator
MRILLVEDEINLSKAIQTGLQHEGYTVDLCHNGTEAKSLMSSRGKIYDLCMLDINLPGADGFEVCEYIRSLKLSVPLLILTARSATEDKVTMLDAGADDYIAKPFSFEELLARIRALLRRPFSQVFDTLSIRDVTIDLKSYNVFKKGKKIDVTKKELMLLEYFMRRPNEVIKREDVYSTLWDVNDTILSNAVDVHIKNIRNKLGYKHGNFIETVRGVGYVLKVQPI